MIRKIFSWEIILALLVLSEILIFGSINERMLDINVLLYSTSDFIYIGIVALPLTLVIITGGIDISFGSVIGLCAIVLGIAFQKGVAIEWAVILALLTGLCCGLMNALLILYTGINPLVITLGTMYLYGGSALLLSGLAGATGYEGIGGFPLSFTNLANEELFGLPSPLLAFIFLLIVFALLLRKTRIGRNIFLLGQNPKAAKYSAIPENATLFIVYGLTSLMAAVSAVLLVSYFGSARSDLGSSLLMPAITAVVLGGANIYGGSGSVIGTAFAALLIGYLQQGLQMAGISNQISSALSGGLLIIVVVGRSVSLHREAILNWWRKKQLFE